MAANLQRALVLMSQSRFDLAQSELRRALAYDPNDVKPGWIALVLVLALAVATFLLWRSMNTQLRKIKAPYRADVLDQERKDATGTPEERADSTTEDAGPDGDSTQGSGEGSDPRS